MMSMDVDEILQRIGEFGPSQWKIHLILCLSMTFTAITTLNLAFIGSDPGWTCVFIEDGAHTAPNQQKKVNIVDSTLKCFYYGKGECKPVYSDDFTSIVTEWYLICSKSSLPNLAVSAFFVGVLFGSWVLGTLADKIGRKKVFFLANLFATLSTIGCSFAPGYYSFTFFKITTAFGKAGIAILSFVIPMEIIGVQKRALAGILINSFFAAGYVVLAIMAYYIRSWRVLSLLSSVLGFVTLTFWKAILESPRWLLVNGREEEARHVLDKIARGNGTHLPMCELKKPAAQLSSETITTRDLFRGRNIRHRTLIMIIAWFTCCMVYYALALTAGELGGNRYVSFSLSGLVEIPAHVAAYVAVSTLGRKWSTGGMLILSGSGCLAWTVLHWLGNNESLKMMAALIGKCAIAGAYATVCLYAVELFPTQARTVGMGTINIGARMGGILAPIVLLLASYNAGLPMLVMGGLSVVTGILCLSLPETLNQPMPETLAELEGSTS